MSDAHLDQIRTALAAGFRPSRWRWRTRATATRATRTTRPTRRRITHLRVRVVSEAFRGKSRIDRHRLVNGLLAGEIAGGLHALAIDAKAPGE